ncbi:homeobox protein HAT3.1 [Senna tora]|uniref:Homeobox protein HAT3.1 n=1 Tax=Senna tora TaxID=362788 RepID=A0A834SVH7_9FABA|nr:homeobox protein HAT3.1 [Senna tora]
MLGFLRLSIDKLKPEKELQRAKAEILRRKFKIRDLFRHLDTLCAEGKLPESLFDSDGEIDSEDIFCSKCGSKDLSTDNDIILCDGACDRGFHQLCLEPPLLTENIPPDNESWLCPGCDCKDDCIELLNESFGMNLSIGDTWERIFPEAAAAAGNNVDHNSGLPSEDSDDDDYNPDVSEDKEIKGDESNFDESEYASASESEYASASEKLENSRNEDQYLGLPSDDSEDDDYDPNALNIDKKINEESSSSDFTSDSEDLATTIKDNMFSEQDEDPLSTSLGDSKQFKGSGRQRGKAGKKQTLADELSSLLESDPGQEGSSPISAKRNVERLDYKKLYDVSALSCHKETYQNTESDTSDDEDWTDNATASRRKKLTCKVTPVSTNGKASTVDHTQRETAPSPSRCKRQNKVENTNNTPTKSLEGSRISSSGNKKHGSSTYKKLGEAVVQRLYKSFEENRYPDRATKESLAQELGLTFRQVDKWFTNTRWSHRNSPQTEVGPGRKKVALEQAACCKAENQESLGDKDSDCELVSQECSGEKLKTPSSRKMKREPDPQASDSNLEVVNVTTQPPAGSSGAQVVQKEKVFKCSFRRLRSFEVFISG